MGSWCTRQSAPVSHQIVDTSHQPICAINGLKSWGLDLQIECAIKSAFKYPMYPNRKIYEESLVRSPVFPAWQHRPSHGRDGSDLAQGLSTPHSQKKYRLLTPSSHVRSLHKKRPGVRFLPGGGKCLAMDFIDAVFFIKILYKNCKKQVHKGYPLAGPCICN